MTVGDSELKGSRTLALGAVRVEVQERDLTLITEQAALQLDNRGPRVGDWRPTPPPDRAERVRRTVIESV